MSCLGRVVWREGGDVQYFIFSVWTIRVSYIFLYFSSHVLLFCMLLSTLLEGEMLLQYNLVLRGYHKMFHCWACISLVKQAALKLAWWKITFRAFPDYFVSPLPATCKCSWSCSGRLNVLVCTWKRRLASCKLQVIAGAHFEGFPSCSGCTRVKVQGLVTASCCGWWAGWWTEWGVFAGASEGLVHTYL